MKAMIRIASAQFEGWGCSECAWIFRTSGPPFGDSLEEMKRNYEQRRDKEFASHVCAKHPKASGEKHG
jgi:hypothetical protein